jgi:predicted MFS family arabinose efflux permease
MRSTDRFTAAQGAIPTAHGIGAALSTTLAGLAVFHVGYSAAFLALAAVAAVGLVVFIVAMPETRTEQPAQRDGAAIAAARRVAAE